MDAYSPRCTMRRCLFICPLFHYALRTIVLKVGSLGLNENTDANHTPLYCTVTMPYEKEANITIHVCPAYISCWDKTI